MTHADLPLFKWTPPRQVIPFPADKRTGHARRVAGQLDKARSNREADFALTRACKAFCNQLGLAGIPQDEIDRQHEVFLQTISRECLRIGAKWMPMAPEQRQHDGGGAA